MSDTTDEESMVVTIFLQPWTSRMPFHTCKYAQIPAPLRQHVTKHKQLVPFRARHTTDASNPNPNVDGNGNGDDNDNDTNGGGGDERGIITATLVIQLGRMLNVSNIEIQPVLSALDELFGITPTQQHRYKHVVLCIILKHLGMDTTECIKSICVTGQENTDTRLFAVRFINRLPEEIASMIGQIDFNETMLISALKVHSVSPAALSQTVNPIQFEEPEQRLIYFMRRKRYTLDDFQRAPGNNLQTGMTPMCVYTGNNRPLLVVHFEPPTKMGYVFTVTDDARIHTVGKMQLVVTLPRCNHDMFICLLPQQAILELLDTRDISPIYDNNISISRISARMCLARNCFIQDHPNNVLKMSTDDNKTLVSATSACTSITLDTNGTTTIEHDVGHIITLSAVSATFRSQSTAKHTLISSSYPNMGVNVSGLVTRVVFSFDGAAAAAAAGGTTLIEFSRFDQMSIDNLVCDESQSVKTVSILCPDSIDSQPSIFRRNACTSCPMCFSLLNTFRNELVFPIGISERHVLYAILDNDSTFLPRSIETDNDDEAVKAYRRDCDTVSLVRYMLHIANELPYMSTVFSPEIQSRIESVRADEYLQMHVRYITRPSAHLSTGDDKWVQLQAANATHDVLCSYWDLPASTIFVGTKKISAIVQIPRDRACERRFMSSVVMDGVSALKRRGEAYITLYQNTHNADIFMFARCQNGNDRVITTQTSKQQHVSFGAGFRSEKNEKAEHVQEYMVGPCDEIPELPIVKYGGHVFSKRVLLCEWYSVNDSKIILHRLNTNK